MDFVISKEDMDLISFKRTLRTIVNPRLIELGLNEFQIRVGYGNVIENTVENFTESLVQVQWNIALNKLMKHRENSGPKSAENLHLIVSVNEAITTVSRNEINTVCQLDASVGLSNVTSSSADVCKKRKLEESTDCFEKNPVDIESLHQTNEWADTDQQFCSENTFIEDMNTVTEFADCILFENTLNTFDKPDELMAHEQTESSHLSNTMEHSVKKDFMSDIEVPGKYPQCENESIQKKVKDFKNANINWTKTDINWAADYKLPTLDSQFTDAPLTVNKCLEESIGK